MRTVSRLWICTARCPRGRRCQSKHCTAVQDDHPQRVAVPDKIDTSIGTLKLSDGYPDADTIKKIYDNLDQSRALQAYLMAIPIVNQAGMRDSMRQFGPDNQTTLSGNISSIQRPSN